LVNIPPVFGYRKTFGRHLQKIRREKGISQADLAFGWGMEISQISRLERGLLNTGLSNILLIAKNLDIHPRELFDF